MLTGKQEPIGALQYAAQLLQPAKDTLVQVSQDSVKKVVLTMAMLGVATFVQDHLAGILGLGILVVLDQLTGVAAALKQHKFSSFRFRAGIMKLFVYCALIVAFHIMGGMHPLLDAAKIDNVAIMYLAATEALSIAENVQIVTGIHLPDWVKALIKAVGRKK